MSDLVETALRTLFRAQHKRNEVLRCPRFTAAGCWSTSPIAKPCMTPWIVVNTVALMREHGIRQVVTRDADFHRFKGIEVVDPVSM
jgi:hypothetical protein